MQTIQDFTDTVPTQPAPMYCGRNAKRVADKPFNWHRLHAWFLITVLAALYGALWYFTVIRG